MRRSLAAALFAAAVCAAPALARSADAPVILSVDAREAPRVILHAHETVPAQPGTMTLVYPKWIPGEHGPTGPIANLAALVIKGGGAVLPWRRDQVDGYAFSVSVPSGVTALDVQYDFLLGRGGNFSSGASSTPNLVVINWNQLVLVPAGYRSATQQITPSITLPTGWKFGTALPHPTRRGDTVSFDTVSLETLVDSPLNAGAYERVFPLYAAGDASAEVDAVADSESALAFSPQTQGQLRNLVREALALYGARHWQHYHFLLTLSDNVTSFGLEHHQSSDDRVGERDFVDDDKKLLAADLLPHEFTHSWNGKFRRPAGLATPDYQQPMRDDLLWVYEGLTQYYGDVLAYRSGLRAGQYFPDDIAATWATLDAQSGRRRRSLGDTATFASVLYNSPGYGGIQRRGVDFYPEGFLLWLDADTLIRTQTHGRKSLDDFAKAFVGIKTMPPSVFPYTRRDVIAALGGVMPYDWASFLRDRVDRIALHPPSGFTRSGWHLAYAATPTEWQRREFAERKVVDLRSSVGLVLTDEGAITDIVGDSPAARAGLGYGMKLIAIGGRTFSGDAANEALVTAQRGTGKVSVIVDDLGVIGTRSIAYAGGPRYARLVRTPGQPDRLTAIVRAQTHR